MPQGTETVPEAARHRTTDARTLTLKVTENGQFWGVCMSTKVLIAIDGSEPSLRAVDFTIEHIRKTPGVSFLLLHVWNASAIDLLGAVEAMDEGWLRDAEKRSADKALIDAVKKCETAGVDFKAISRSGHVAESITQTAHEEDAHYIVMGTRGLGGVEGLLLGSVANQVIHLAETPVTLVK